MEKRFRKKRIIVICAFAASILLTGCRETLAEDKIPPVETGPPVTVSSPDAEPDLSSCNGFRLKEASGNGGDGRKDPGKMSANEKANLERLIRDITIKTRDD